MRVNKTTIKCVEKCPLLTYSDPVSKECLPCYKDCYECTGPKETIGPGGCTKCSNALVSNDAAYSIVKCIAKEVDTCGDNHFIKVVPENLKTHPLKGKRVCRKCDDECDNCYDNGVQLHTQCEKCRNFYSVASNECVSNCSMQRNEYAESGKQVCRSCSSECKSGKGCRGSGVHECNECRAYKLSYTDAKRYIDHLNDLKSRQHELDTQMNNSLRSQLEFYREFIQNFNQHMLESGFEYMSAYGSSNIDRDRVEFCVSECPAMLPYKTANMFCTDNKKSQYINFFCGQLSRFNYM